MKLRFLALVVGLVVFAGSAYAQIGIYVGPNFTHISNSQADTGTFAFLGSGNTSKMFSGADFGVYDQFWHGQSVDAGADMRVNIQRGAGAHLNEFLIGARVAAAHPMAWSLKPYGELLGGEGSTNPATNPVSRSKATFAIMGGVEKPLGKHVDWRVIEVGYGSLQTVSTGLVTGAANPPGSSTLINFSTGIVFRFPEKKLIP
ncbi:hypothetical protein [Granulicella arctica]|uniref:Outer membrane protein beta-barrel domain-containing protein n=1 Tax=Granulicella arctica TaxID=940613 RepID=A0A7Y9PG97_9BACT|nr:hypothetical protein [Granulicella arctica]NYF78606.1 hypothetical protein [Granulicella arctica]